MIIKDKRKDKNYTQEKMSNLLNISLRQYIRIDNEEDLPRKDVLKKLFDVLEFSAEEIGLYIKEVINKENYN